MSDLIDRQAVIDALEKWFNGVFGIKESDGTATIFKRIRELPTAEPKKGKWIAKENRPKQEIFICSECKGWAYSPWIGSRKSAKKNWCKYAFCPNCGADMRGGEE